MCILFQDFVESFYAILKLATKEEAFSLAMIIAIIEEYQLTLLSSIYCSLVVQLLSFVGNVGCH